MKERGYSINGKTTRLGTLEPDMPQLEELLPHYFQGGLLLAGLHFKKYRMGGKGEYAI